MSLQQVTWQQYLFFHLNNNSDLNISKTELTKKNSSIFEFLSWKHFLFVTKRYKVNAKV